MPEHLKFTPPTPTPEPTQYEIVNVSASITDDEVVVDLVLPGDETVTLIVAAYNTKGKLVSIASVSPTNGENVINLALTDDVALIKVFLWNDLIKMRPLCPHFEWRVE